MELVERLVKVCDPVTMTGKKGNTFTKQELIFETVGDYPHKICVTLMGDKAVKDPSILEIGKILSVNYEIDSREYNGKWFTTIKAWRISDPRDRDMTPKQPNRGHILPQQTNTRPAPLKSADNTPIEDNSLPF